MTAVDNRCIQEKRGNFVRPSQVIVGCIPVLRVILSEPLQPLWYSKWWVKHSGRVVGALKGKFIGRSVCRAIFFKQKIRRVMLAFYWNSQNSGPDTKFKETVKPYSINAVKELMQFIFSYCEMWWNSPARRSRLRIYVTVWVESSLKRLLYFLLKGLVHDNAHVWLLTVADCF